MVKTSMSPARAILLHSPGRKPWVNYWKTFIEPQRGGTSEWINSDARAESAAPSELLIFVFSVYPGFHFGLYPHSTLGYARVSCLKALVIRLNVDNNAASAVLYNGLLLKLSQDIAKPYLENKKRGMHCNLSTFLAFLFKLLSSTLP